MIIFVSKMFPVRLADLSKRDIAMLKANRKRAERAERVDRAEREGRGREEGGGEEGGTKGDGVGGDEGEEEGGKNSLLSHH